MTQKMKTAIGVAVFALLIAGAMFAYNALRGSVAPEVTLVEQPGNISAAETELPLEDEDQEDAPNAETETAEEEEDSESGRTMAPDFALMDSEGNSFKLSNLRGTPVVLNLWASWCPPCKAEMPEFDKVYGEMAEEVAFMMVDLIDGQQETKATGEAYVAEQGYAFPVYYDTNQEAAYAYGVRSIPTTYFIDSEGYVVAGAEGQINEETLRRGISMILGGDAGADDSD